MYRYRKETGVSRDVVVRFRRHRPKLGTITRIVGKFYATTKGTGDRAFPATCAAVMIYGTAGTARFDGVGWQYSGEGSRALLELLLAAGVAADKAHDIVDFDKRRGDWGQEFPDAAALFAMPRRTKIAWDVALTPPQGA